MSAFSEMLQSEIDSNNLSAMRISACTNISRPTVAKIINGQRLPTMEELVSIMALMPLTVSKRVSLMEELDNLRFGNGIYSSLKSALSKMERLPVAYKTDGAYKESSEITYPENGILMINSRPELLYYALAALKNEIKNHSCPTVYTNTTRNYSILQENMVGLLVDADGKINFKICTQITKGTKKGSVENFEQLFDWTPFFMSNCDILYEYSPELTDVVPFGFTDYLVLSDVVIFANERLDKAMFITDKKTVEEVKTMCTGRMYGMKSLVRRCADVFEFFEFLKKTAMRVSYANYMQFAPCVIPFLEYEEAKTVARLEIPEVAAILPDIFEYYRKFISCVKKGAFTQKGIEDFLRNGKLFEIPEEYVNPVPKELRCKLLYRMLDMMENGDTDFRIINENFLKYPENACIEYVKDLQLVFTYKGKEKNDFSGRVNVVTAEATLLEEAASFFDNLFESRYLYTKKQSIDIFKRCLNDAE